IQFDFNLPERFDMTYVGQDGLKHRPFMVHRALLGSLERFFGILIEHYAGAFPVWLSPEQVRILPISEKFNDYAYSLAEKLKAAHIRYSVDDAADTIGGKIRKARNMRIPYMLVVGEREAANGEVAVRSRKGEEGAQPFDAVLARIQQEIADKA
ncbi:MAG: threonine--tRNA ligase, partial [Victivallales bacterium]|nr:threonine--tRNA ligase [Victivallales bacterium]